jgi:putative membrane-bound dehydrogenase-like protein
MRPKLGRAMAILFFLSLPAAALAADDPPRTGPFSESRFPPLKLPEGFRATLFACDPMIEYPSAISAGPRVGSVYVAIDFVSGLGAEIVRRDEVRLVEDVDHDGYADKAVVVASGFNSIQGLAYHDGRLYVMHAPFLSVVDAPDGNVRPGVRRDLLTGLGLPPEKNPSRLHCANGVVVGHDGWLYLALGDNGCDVLRPEGDRLVFQGGGILRCRPDGRDLHVYSTGLRNIYDIALDEDLNVFVRDNENDGGDYLLRVDHSFFGADHGYPYLYAERPDEALPSLAILGRGSSAGGLCYLETGFPAEFRGNLFLCEWGRAVMRYPLERSGGGFASVQEIEFASGGENDPYGFKPTDLTTQRDGSLFVADWADGQQPKRGRGRIYRITASERKPHPRPAGTGIDVELALLDSPSLTDRVDAQIQLERRGPEAIPAVLTAIRERRLGVLGRMHAVWILAHVGGLSHLDGLMDLIRTDSDPRVQAQAVRAVADLADPVFIQHTLAGGPGDAVLAARLAALAHQRDPRVVLELILTIGRLRWADAPSWLHQTLKKPDPALAHAAMQTLRRSANWPALLAFLDEPDREPMRDLALAAIADRAEPVVVDGLLARLETERNPERLRQYTDVLSRVYRKPKPWTYWGYRPAPRPANSVDWERTEAIGKALNRTLAHPDYTLRVALLQRMQREEIPTCLATLHGWLREERDREAVSLILASVRSHPADARRDLLAELAADRSRATCNRLEAMALWSGGNDEPAAARLLTLVASLEDGPVLAAAMGDLTEPSMPQATSLILGKLASPDPQVRTAAIEAAIKLRVPGAEERLRERLVDTDSKVRRAASVAAGALGLRASADRLLELVRDPDPAVRSASLDSLRRLNDSRAVPLAAAALADRETQFAALMCLAELGGPVQSAVVIDLAKRSPSADLLPLAVRTLTEWSRERKLSPAQRFELDRAVAEIQGVTGLLARWEFSPTMPSETAAAVVVRNSTPSRPFESINPAIGPWSTGFAAGADSRLRFPGDAEIKEGLVRLASTDLLISDPASVQFLASCSGTLRVWADGNLIHDRSKVHAFQADSDRFQVDLAGGLHRLFVEVGSATNQAAEFHLRFRRKSSTAKRERLAQMALTSAGDPESGRTVLEDIEKSQCLRCHRFGDRGERIGPELSRIGGRFSRITLIESILEPSRSIAPSFDSVTVGLTDGRVLSGVRVEQTASAVTIADQEGKRHTILKAEIEALEPHPQSTMPDGLENRLTAGEFVDLVSFLSSQK